MEITKYSAEGGVIISEEAISSIATNAAKDVTVLWVFQISLTMLFPQ